MTPPRVPQVEMSWLRDADLGALPPQRRGVLVVLLLANAVVTVVLYPLVAARLAVLAVRTWRGRDRAAAGLGGLDAAAVGVLAAHLLARRRLVGGVRRLVGESGSAGPPA
jgi:hypothetical protein